MVETRTTVSFGLEAQVKIQGFFLENPDRALSIFEEEFSKSLETATSFLMRAVLRGAPVHTGTLRSSVFREIRGTGLSLKGIVATNLAYSRFIETGKPAHEPNYDNLANWIRMKMGLSGRHLHAVLQVVARQIRTRGVRPRRMFEKAFNLGKNTVQGMLDQTATRIIERWEQ